MFKRMIEEYKYNKSIKRQAELFTRFLIFDDESPFYKNMSFWDFSHIKNSLVYLFKNESNFKYFLETEQPEVAYKVLFNVVTAANEVFKNDWDDLFKHHYGINGILEALPDIMKHGFQQRTLTKDFFTFVFSQVNSREIAFIKRCPYDEDYKQKMLKELFERKENFISYVSSDKN